MVMAMNSSDNPHSSRQFSKGLKAKKITTWRFVGHENVSALFSKQSEVCWICGFRLRSSQLQTATFDDIAAIAFRRLTARKLTFKTGCPGALSSRVHRRPYGDAVAIASCRYSRQLFLYFLSLPRGHGSLRPKASAKRQRLAVWIC